MSKGRNQGFFEPCWTPIGEEVRYVRDDSVRQVKTADGWQELYEPGNHSHRILRIEEEARQAVEGPRNCDYGHPRDNHGRTALLQQAYLHAKYGDTEVDLTPEDVCYMNILQKISRQMHSPKRDNLVDIIGYVLNLDMLDD